MAVLLITWPAFAGEKVTVVVPDHENLQFASFWVALHGGHFAKEGLDVEVIAPPGPSQTGRFFLEHGEAEAAVLPPPVFLTLVSERAPVVLVANLLQNDPIDLVVRRSVAEARHVSTAMPLRERLIALRGVKLGVAPHPPARLRALYASVGLDVDRDAELVILHGKEQNAAFTAGEVDALYAHTPYLERAIVHDDAVVIVDQARGEVPALANRQIHGLVFRSGALELRRAHADAAYRAIAAAESRFHEAPREVVDVLARAYPKRDRRDLETIVAIYAPAIPATPKVVPIDLPRWLDLFPAGNPKPDLTGIDLAPYVVDLAAKAESTEPRSSSSRWLLVAAGVLLAALVAALNRT